MKKRQKRIAEDAIKKIAERDGVSVEYVRKQMQIAMLNGLCSTDPKIKKFWDSIPKEGDIPTPEELIVYTAEIAKHRGPV